MPLPLRSWEIRASLTALGVIAVAALADVTATGAVWPQFGGFVPAVCIVAALADALTAALLLSYVHYAPRRLSTKLLVVLFGGATLDAIAMLLCRPSIPGGTPLIHVSPQAGTWLDVGWQVVSGIAALAYAYLRNSSSDRTYSRRATIGILTLASGVFIAVIAGIMVFGAGLPVLAIGATFTPAFRYLVAPLIAGVTGVAGFAVLRARNGHFLDRAFGYAMLAMMLGALLTAVAGERFSPAWYLARMLFVGTTLLMLAATMRKLFASRLQVRAAERTLERARTDVMRHAQRMQALWRIAEQTDLTDEARLHAVLDVGVKTLRPGSAMEGYICHLVQGTVVVDAVAHENGHDAIHPILSPGASFDLDRSMQSKISAGAGTCVWNDLGEFHSRNMICKDLGWQSFIGTPLQVGRTLHFLIFGSPYSMDGAPFQQDDVAFMDVLGTFLAHQLSSRVQLDRIQYQIEHDALTGLRNRTQFRTALRSAVALNRPFAVAYLDLDRFRAINEIAGNMIGDELLVEVAVGLSSVAERDFVARTSGDGFAIIMPDALSTDDVTARVAQYKELFRIPFHTGDREGTRMLSVTSSFGVAVYPDHGPTADDLVRSADVALDIAKERGGDVAVFFEPAMGPSAELRYAKSIELSEAIEAGGLMLAYQPTFVLDTCRIVGSEALVRWNHPERGVLPPGEFIAFAERNGLIGRMTRWVIDRAIGDLSSMPSIPHDFRCYVNLSMAQIDDLAFIAELEERLRFVPRIAEHLGIEITETAAITNTQSSMYALERFRKLGMRVAIDDFGTGYSSLSYLKRLPVDVIKIDRSFITGLPADEKDGALCELLLQIASRFGLTALAEGIETFDQLSWLRQHGCSSGQGFLIAKPLPFAEMTAMLERDRPPAELRLAR